MSDLLVACSYASIVFEQVAPRAPTLNPEHSVDKEAIVDDGLNRIVTSSIEPHIRWQLALVK